MNKNVKYYERILKKRVEARTKLPFEEWLEPQLHAAALCQQMLEKVHEEIMNGKLTTIQQGSKDQWYTEVNPLMPTYKELQRTMIQHYEALGLNYKSKPSNIKEPVAQGGEEHDKLGNLLKDIQGV
jgi:phage terminase small subunit